MPATKTASQSATAYGSVFWLAYAANALTMIAVSLLVRYADFVTYLGGSEGRLGLVVGIGMIGSLAMRLAQGVSIDHYGPRTIWLWSLVLFVVSLVAHLWVQTAMGPAIFVARIVMQTSIAGIFGASITYMSRRVPPNRMAEMVGTLGTSGFVGLLIGPQLADWIMRGDSIGRGQLDQLFLAAAGLGCVAFLAAWGATRGQSLPRRRRRPPLTALLRRYHPGPMMLVAAAVGAGIALPNTFLRTFAAERSIAQIGVFFSTYAVVAFIVRMATRQHFQRYANVVWVLCGLAALSTSILLYLIVHNTWQLAIPGFAAGVAHALLFPSVVAGGCTTFPERYRGLATTLMLAMFDVGSLVGTPLVGGMLMASRQVGIAPYPATFATVAAGLTIVGGYFAIASRGETGEAIVRPRRNRLRGGSATESPTPQPTLTLASRDG